MPKKWTIFFLSSLLAFLLTLTTITHSQIPPTSSPEIRGVWLTNVASGVLFVPWGVHRALNQLANLNFNTIYPVVWNRGHTFYPSEVGRQITGRQQNAFLSLTKPFQDILKFIVEKGNEKNLKVVPWFEYGFMTPANSLLAKRHPDWLTTRRDNREDFKEVLDEQAATELAKQKPLFSLPSEMLAVRQVWLNPLHPQVQTFMQNLILEVVNNYAIQGIQIDDHFGMPVELGYDPLTVKLYQQEHEGKNPPNNPKDKEWMRWRADKITEFIAKLNKEIKATKPDVKISLSPNSQGFSYNNYLQDWQTWVNRGLVDELILQVYRNDIKRFNRELEDPAIQEARKKIPVIIGITTGTWRNPVPVKQIQEQVNIVRDKKFAGVSFFYWESLWSYLTPESPQQRRNSFQKTFADTPPEVEHYFSQQMRLFVDGFLEFFREVLN
ncbi:family 10 glycosylhydrolase [Ancylothrix sp. C2]|uniref:glycoside hydrolase family 10 protein n=1 Tax=Ancylothrix sp. D3o TaxID=2953691 RepID=UPI0021BB9375|nr:glycoside hydrolase family 10 protein [Ancylothrix sp. D3o]MCT7950452.1 family 10 glycosylhydrolase [Ancylothrix sp. D3o]